MNAAAAVLGLAIFCGVFALAYDYRGHLPDRAPVTWHRRPCLAMLALCALLLFAVTARAVWLTFTVGG